MIVSDYIADRLVALGIAHVFGVGGANIEDTFAAIQRRRPRIRAVLGKHEHAAGTAADAYARLTGGLGVVLVTSGGAAMNLVHSLAEARASGVPVLAIVGEPPTEVQGVGAFQDTSGRGGAIDAAAVFSAVSVWCARVERPRDVPRLLAEAIASALGTRRGPAVLLVAKDRQRAELPTEGLTEPPAPLPAEFVDLSATRQAAALLRHGAVVIIAGEEVARTRAKREFAAVARAVDAQVAVAPEARDAFDNYSPRFLGVSGAMGTPAVASALAAAQVCLVVGTRLPLLTRQGLEPRLAEVTLISLGRERLFVAAARGFHVEADVLAGLRLLSAELGPSLMPLSDVAELPRASSPIAPAELSSRSALTIIERALPEGSVLIVDAGNTGAWAAHALRVPREGRWLLAMGMAGMGYGFGAAIGAAFATGRRCIVLAGDGAFFMNGLDIHTAVQHALPITYVIFDNRAHGMCLVRERLLLDENAGYNTFRRSHIGAGLGAMFPGLFARDCRTNAELEGALEQASNVKGPAVISVELDVVEIPPFAALLQAAKGSTTVSRGASDEGD